MAKRRFAPSLLRRIYFAKYNLIPFRSSMVSNHIRRRFKSKFQNANGYRIIDLALTYACNLKCEHCSAHTLMNDKPALTLDSYKDIVREAEKLENLSWNLTGGEPLTVDWLYDLIPILKPQKHYISIQTNAILLDRKRARELAHLGVNCITTSLDSYDENEHNSFRGVKGAYKKTIDGIKNAREAGMQILIGGVVSHHNLHSKELELLIQKANDLGAIFLFNIAVPCGNWSGNYDIVLRGEDRDYLIELMNRYPKTTTDHEVGRNAIGCPAGAEKCYITPYGDVLPCPFIHITFGNIQEEPLGKIIKRMQSTKYFSEYQPICLAGEDTTLHKNVFSIIYEVERNLPVSYKNLEEELNG